MIPLLLHLLACTADKPDPADTANPDTTTTDTGDDSVRDSPPDTVTTDTVTTETGCPDPLTTYPDGDGDGYGDPSLAVEECALSKGRTLTAGDCDDADATLNPDATETLSDGVDSDCDGWDECGEGDLYVDYEGYLYPGAQDIAESFCPAYSGVLAGLETSDDTGVDPDDYSAWMVDFSNLSCLCHVGGDLFIRGNNNLVNLHGLEGLTRIHGYLFLDSCPSLIDFTGLDNVTEIAGYVNIVSAYGNRPTLQGLNQVRSIGVSLYTRGIDSWIGLDSLESVPGIGIRDATSLEGAPRLSALEDLYIYYGSISDLSPLDPIAALPTGLYLVAVQSLTNLTTLPTSLTSIGEIHVSFSDSFTSLDGLGPVSVGAVYLEDTPNLTDISALAGNTTFTELNLDQTGLENLVGLEELQVVDGDLTLTDNLSLTDIASLGALRQINGNLVITGNASLPTADANALVGQIGTANILGVITIDGNGP